MNDISQSGEQTMSSLEIAQITNKRHSHVMEAIRKMEESWLGLGQPNFRLATYKDAQGKERPCYQLTKTESLYVSTKFRDDARGKLVLRWKELEIEKLSDKKDVEKKPMSAVQMFALQAQINLENENRLNALEKKIENLEQEREENKQQLLALPISTNQVPKMTMRKNIIALINSYCSSTNTAQQDVWHKIYSDLYYRYGKSINNYKKVKNSESKLDVAERNGLLPYIMDIVSEMVSKIAQSA